MPCRDFLTELCCNTIISCFSTFIKFINFNTLVLVSCSYANECCATVLLGVSKPRLLSCKFCDCMLHDLKPHTKGCGRWLVSYPSKWGWRLKDKMTATRPNINPCYQPTLTSFCLYLALKVLYLYLSNTSRVMEVV